MTVASNNLSALPTTSLSVTASAISIEVSSCNLSVKASDPAPTKPTVKPFPNLPLGILPFIAVTAWVKDLLAVPIAPLAVLSFTPPFIKPFKIVSFGIPFFMLANTGTANEATSSAPIIVPPPKAAQGFRASGSNSFIVDCTSPVPIRAEGKNAPIAPPINVPIPIPATLAPGIGIAAVAVKPNFAPSPAPALAPT